MGRSAGEYFKSIKRLARPGDCRPSQDVNSVNITSALPYLAIICRNAQSVTLAIGARAIIGCFPLAERRADSCNQKLVEIFLNLYKDIILLFWTVATRWNIFF